jgi:hypothetical protein
MRQIEDELTEGHEVLTREPAPVLIGDRSHIESSRLIMISEGNSFCS